MFASVSRKKMQSDFNIDCRFFNLMNNLRFKLGLYLVKKNVSTFTTLLPTIAPVFAITDGNALNESLIACC